MAIIYSYPNALVTDSIRLVGSNTAVTGNPTISLSVANLADFVLAQFSTGTKGYLPYYDTVSTLSKSYILQDTTTVLVTVEENINLAKNLTVAANATVTGDFNGTGGAFSQKLSVADGLTVGTGAIPASSISLYGPTTAYKTLTVGTSSVPSDSTFYGDVRLNLDLIDILGQPGTLSQVLSSKGNGLGTQWVDQIQSGIAYQGTWDANLNIPVLASGVGTAGFYYIVDVAGATNLDGIVSWSKGDWAIFSSTNVWQKVDNTSVLSGAGIANTVPKWVGATTLGDSLITDDGTTITLDTTTITLQGTAIPGSQTNLWSEITDVKGSLVIGDTVNAGGTVGTAGQLLSSTVTGVDWVDSPVSTSVPEVSFSVYNNTGSTITKGTPCKIVGEFTYLGTVYPLLVPGSGAETNCVGVAASDVITASVGKVLVTGMLEDIITSPMAGGGIPSAGTKVFQKADGLVIIRPIDAAGPIQIVGRVFVVSAIATGKIWIDVKNQVEELPNVTSTKVLVGNTFNEPVESTILSVDDTNTQVAVGGLSTAVATDFISLITKSSGIKANWLQYGENSDVLSTDLRYTIQNSTLTTGLSYNLVNSDLGDFYISKGDPSIGAAVVEEKIASFTSQDIIGNPTTQNLVSFYDNNFTSGDDAGDNPFGAGAFRSVAFGINNTMQSDRGFAVGNACTVSGLGATAIGFQNVASGQYAFSHGSTSNATGTSSIVLAGVYTTVSGDYSISVGVQNLVSGDRSVVFGDLTSSSGDYSFSVGSSNTTTGVYSNVMGLGITDNSNYSIATGKSHSVTGTGYSAVFGLSHITDQGYNLISGQSNTTVGATHLALFGQSNSVTNASHSLTAGLSLTNVRQSSTVLGQYNLVQAAGEIFTVGSGTSAVARATAVSLIGTFGADYELKVSGNIWGTGGIKDSSGALGTAGQILSSTVTGTSWTAQTASTSLNALSDVLIQGDSYYIGTIPLGLVGAPNSNITLGDAGTALTSADRVTLIGKEAGNLLTTGGSNTAIGAAALSVAVDATACVAIGDLALLNNVSGDRSVAVGSQALTSENVAGIADNVGVGYISGYNITSGTNNTAIGGRAAGGLTTGSSNIYLGNTTTASSSGVTNEIVIGNSVTGQGTNSILLGNSATTLITGINSGNTNLGSLSNPFKDIYLNTGTVLTGAMAAAPASATAIGVLGDVRFTADYIYVCVATNTWKRSAIVTW